MNVYMKKYYSTYCNNISNLLQYIEITTESNAQEKKHTKKLNIQHYNKNNLGGKCA